MGWVGLGRVGSGGSSERSERSGAERRGAGGGLHLTHSLSHSLTSSSYVSLFNSSCSDFGAVFCASTDSPGKWSAGKSTGSSAWKKSP